jgi:alcohol dehydrogenase (cytochrome c)
MIMSISIFVKTITLYSIVIVSFLSIFQTSSTIIDVLASSIDDPDRISTDGFDISYRMNDQKVRDLKNHFETGLEDRNKNNWVFVNHDIYGSRNSNQTQIDKSNVGDLKVKWRLNNTYEIQDPPIIVNGSGYFQDYIGNIISFDTQTGSIKWRLDLDGGPTMGLYFSDGIIYATVGTKAKIISVDSKNGEILWESPKLGNTGLGYAINSPPLIWKDYVIAGSGGSGLPPGKGFVKGNITALNKTDGSILWNIDTTTGAWVENGKNPPNGGATAWSGGSIDADTGIAYIPLGSASPNFNASTRQSPNLYSNHMVAVDIREGKIIWATPFIAHGTVLNVKVPDTHDWDTSWGSSVSNVKFENGSTKKIVIGHDKMGNVIAMDALNGKEIWWTSLGRQVNTDSPPSPSGSGMIWSYGIYNYHAVDEDTLYITATNRGLNFFTDGLSGHKEDPENSIEQGLVNGSIYALDKKSGNVKWKIDTDYPPRVSPMVSNGVVYTGYIKFGENYRTGIILALDSNTGEKLWEYDVRGSISPVGASIGDGMLFVPTDKVNLYPNEDDDNEIGGSIIAFMPIEN